MSEPAPKKRRSLFSRLRRLIFRLMLLWLLLHGLAAAALMYWRTEPVLTSAFMLRHRLTADTPVRHHWVESGRIARSAKQAAIASEDANFATHRGFEWKSIEEAYRKNKAGGRIRAGGSTISQQLAKNLFLFAEKSYARKAEEALLTVMIEHLWSKERILTVYLNTVEFGNGIYGIEAAAQHYYHRPAAQLNAAQSAALIAMLPNPKYYQQHRDGRRLANRTRIILRRMGSAVLPRPEP